VVRHPTAMVVAADSMAQLAHHDQMDVQELENCRSWDVGAYFGRLF
jgi:hypothetical protein